ncbi:hypothetical protein PR202_gb13014 [Eleusine coracana subsp. coracana]|uniref:Major facilitator superfamily (MFS) profile domain-containing protein n=1 Tax=Eleusine coracana subsp. coracana TaxID=191504 RepID=A0AAV5ESP2_ELECO|nr:hypothetical protein PR202_gb13014 [Eleusine coracana subsp. coracana]
MAVGFSGGAEGGEVARPYGGGGRITAFVALSCVTAATGGAIFGYDIGTAGGVSSMDPFLRSFFPDVYRRMKAGARVSNYCKFDSQLLTLFTSSLYITGLLTAVLLASWVTARLGRRPSMIFGGVPYVAGAAVSGGAVNVFMAILGRALLGVGLGFANQAVPLYLSEMAPARYRGAFSNGFQFSLCIGALFATVVNFGAEKIRAGWGWRLSLALAGVPAVLLTVGAIFLPETPNSLVQQGKDHKSVKALLQKIRGTEDVDQEMEDIVWRPTPWRRPRTACAYGDKCHWVLRSGAATHNRHGRERVPVLHHRPGHHLFGINIHRHVGRRPLRPAHAPPRRRRADALVSEVLIGAIMAAKLGDGGGLSRAYAVVLIVLVGVYATGFGWSWGPLSWLVPSEIFPLEIRSAGRASPWRRASSSPSSSRSTSLPCCAR